MDAMVTVKDAAGILGVSAATLRNWDRSGQLRARRHPINKYRIYPLQEVLELQKSLWLFPPDAAREPSSVKDASLSRGELRRLVHSLNRVLRDSEGNSSLVERFDELAKLVLIKAECEKSPELAKAADLAGGGSDAAVTDRLRGAFDAIVHGRPNLFPARFASLHLGERAAAEAARILGAVTLGAHGEDLKGLLFEEILGDTFEKGDNQQFFTPTAVVEFMADLTADWIQGNVADPACGTGGFLIAAASRLRNAAPIIQTETTLWGLEIDARLAWATGLNLHIHDARRFNVAHVEGAGSLSPTTHRRLPPLDLILTNPPFGSDLTDSEALEALQLGAGRKSRRRGVLFLEQCLNLLKPGGCLGVVIDDGVLNAPTNADTRAHLLSRADLFAVVSLPEVAFMPYASVKASILFLQRHGGGQARAMSSRGTFFASAEQVGRKPSGDPLYRFNRVTRRLDLDSDLPSILSAWRDQATDSQLGFWSRLPAIDAPEFSRALHRLDSPFHHPSRARASLMLQSSPHPLRSLSDLCALRSETLVPAEQCAEDEITYVGLASIEPRTGVVSPTVVPGSTLKSSVKRFQSGDILFAKMRPELRKVARIPTDVTDGVASAECIVLVPRRDGDHVILPELLTQLLRSDLVYGQLVHQVMGIGRPRLRPSDVLAVRVPLPPVEQQRALLGKLEQAEAASSALMQESELACAKASQIRIDAIEAMTTQLLGSKAR